MNEFCASRRLCGVAFGFLLAAASVSALASESSPPPGQRPGAGQPAAARSDFDRGMDKVEAEEYAAARKIFEQLAEEQPNNPDVLNMLAYTQRKTGDVDDALANYRRALQLRPKFPQAREYLAEAYLQLALKEAETLRSYGGSGEEQLQKLATSMQAAAAQADPNRPRDGKSASKSKW
jgi:predicted Zn-dependent protease